jgi:hypothetical protein
MSVKKIIFINQVDGLINNFLTGIAFKLGMPLPKMHYEKNTLIYLIMSGVCNICAEHKQFQKR